MPVSRRRSLVRESVVALCVAGLAVLSLACSAYAAEPAKVTVRVEGLAETKLPATEVALSGVPMVKDGNPEHSCGGSSALAALQTGTGGNWAGPWNSKFKQYEIFSIEGETHEFEPKSTANYFWSFWLDDREAEQGACEAQLKPGDRVLFFPSCFGEECPKPAPLPLGIEGTATIGVGEPASVLVKRYTTTGVAAPVPGAAVVGGGAGAITDAQGKAALTFSHAGQTMLEVTAPASIRTEMNVCVHNGNDGTCGTQLAGSSTATGSGSNGNGVKGPPPIPELIRIAGIKNGHVYSPRAAPRILEGTVSVPPGDTLRQVRIRLERRYHGHCFDFNGSRVKFIRAKKCGTASFFSVGGSESFSYLLPKRLPKGRYVYEIEAVDSAGQTTKLVSGVSHVVFTVK